MRRVTENGSRSPGIPIRVDECGSLNAVDSGANSALLVLLAHAATCANHWERTRRQPLGKHDATTQNRR
jgi:hypothetical protein